MRPTKVGTVTVTYWEKKGALMFQGPGEAATELNRQFIKYKQGIKVREETQISNIQEENNEMNRRLEPPITVTRNQITALHQYILNWEKKSPPNQEYITIRDQLRESLIDVR